MEKVFGTVVDHVQLVGLSEAVVALLLASWQARRPRQMETKRGHLDSRTRAGLEIVPNLEPLALSRCRLLGQPFAGEPGT
jgi:hypothetical protein